MPDITIFTPAYNRAHTLKRLYESIVSQPMNEKVEWLVIDDGSTDNTEQLISAFQTENRINIRYYKVPNGGKPRAINRACQLAESEWMFIVDSDDYLAPNILQILIKETIIEAENTKCSGIGVMRSYPNGKMFANPIFEKFAYGTNLERAKLGLDYDCNEVYRISVLSQYPFKVWPGEIFVPEATVLNEMALDGFKIKWINQVGVISEYQEDGMTVNSWRLMKNNPMGYAMSFNHMLKYTKGFKNKLNCIIQAGIHAWIGGHPIVSTQNRLSIVSAFLLPVTGVLSLRRQLQYKKYI